MRSRAGFLVAGAFLLAAVGCGDDGGGGGAVEAFCDELDAFSEDVADGDLTSNRGLDNLVDRLNELIELAGDDQADAVEAVGELVADARPDDAAEVAEEIQDELGDVAEDDCELDDFAAFEPEDEPDDTTTTTEPEVDDTTTTEPVTPPPGGAENPVTAAASPADAGVEPGFEENADLCFRGLMVACDDIFFGENGQAAAPQGSNARVYGGTCGGRILEFVEGAPQRCVDNLFGAGDFDPASFTDPAAVALAEACRGNEDADVDGDMAACDQLFLSTGIGTPEEAYGDTCGGRVGVGVADRQASCVAIWGPVAEFG